jgi:transcriptional regulator with XRE-family HTH domain
MHEYRKGKGMKTNEMRMRFVELRAQGWTMEAIAEELGAGTTTLWRWQRQMRKEVAERSAMEREKIAEQLKMAENQRFERYCKMLERVSSQIDVDDIEIIPTDKLLRMALMLDERITRKMKVE